MRYKDKLNGSLEWLHNRNRGLSPEAPEHHIPEEPLDAPESPARATIEDPGEENLPTPRELKDKAKEEGLPLEKGDVTAMILAGLGTIVPVCLLILVALCLVMWLLFLR